VLELARQVLVESGAGKRARQGVGWVRRRHGTIVDAGAGRASATKDE
jgi:hypothetical protein